ncbi:MAG TPA: hypothetical protein VH008_23715 [Pseudonocardia sp.]|nr:hypothetical protein [Pseudonocardia sp.]
MTKFLLSVHVLAAIITVGPVTVAASMFPPAARRAWATADPTADPTAMSATGPELTVLRILYRICVVYAAAGLLVPMFGLATASSLGVLGEAWLIVSIVLTAAAAAVLALLVLPRQAKILAELTARAGAGAGTTPDAAAGTAPAPARTAIQTRELTVRLAMFTGIFNLLWAVVTVLMILRPGSTTGV